MNIKISNVHIICPTSRINDYLLYCSHAMKLSKINFNSEHINETFSKLIIVDQEKLDHINRLNNSTAFTYLVFFWNGQFGFLYYAKKINILKKKFKKNIFFYLAGNANNIHNIKKITFKKFYNNKNIKIIGAPKLKLFLYQNPFFKSFITLILNPLISSKYLFKKKIIFVGTIREAFSKNKIKIYNKDFINLLVNYSRLNESDKFNYLKNLINIKKFKKLESFYKFYLVQIIYREIFVNIMKRYENFEFFDNDNNIKFYSSIFFKNNCYVDLGTKVGSDMINPRSLLLKKNYKKDTIHLKFFENGNFSNKNFRIEIFKIVSFLENINKIDKKKFSFLETKKILINSYYKSKLFNNK